MRTWLIKAIASLAGAAACAFGPQAATAQSIPLSITNQTGYTGNVYVTIYGSTNPNKNGTYYYVTQSGAVTKFKTSSSTPTNYGFSFSGKTMQVQIPMLQSARVYVSFCAPVLLTVSSGTPAAPDGWTPGSTNFNTQFDFVEYTWTPSTGPGGSTQIWVDTTQVDAFGLPIRTTLAGTPYGKPTRLVGGFDSPTAGNSIIAALRKAGAPWSNLIVSSKNRPIRLISPVHAMALETSSPYYFDEKYWDSYINTVFNTYSKGRTSFTIDTGGAAYTGVVRNNQMYLTPKNGDPATVFGKPSSQYLWGNGVPPVRGGNVAALQKYIQAAFLRSTFLTNPNLSDCSGAAPYTAAPVNQYSKVIHQFAYQQEAYTFPYDDVCSLSSTTSLLQPTALNLTLYPLTSDMAKMTCP
ncbi:beta-1,3-glucanase family protein [Xanthobacter sp. V4C-4]|uniref:beta-1,3-glucanase family protein n=1 Tax=Xanthobacter cornucopiae TaxID=3119924 RepID=UPI00372B9903